MTHPRSVADSGRDLPNIVEPAEPEEDNTSEASPEAHDVRSESSNFFREVEYFSGRRGVAQYPVD